MTLTIIETPKSEIVLMHTSYEGSVIPLTSSEQAQLYEYLGVHLSNKLRNAQPVQPSALERMEEAPDEMIFGDADEYEYIRSAGGQESPYLWHDRKRFAIYLKGYRLMRNAALQAAEEGRNAEVS